MIYDFTAEYRKDPIGLDEAPRFSWKLKSERQDTMQKGYRLQVISRGKCVWDSGLCESEQSLHIPYEGEALAPKTRYLAQVSVWDSYGEMQQAKCSFETGLMGAWTGEWISHSLAADDVRCPVFHKALRLTKPLAAARLCATAAGVYEAELNGEKVGDAFMAPGWTSYRHRLQYQTYDVTALLREGENELSVTLGNGWFKGYLGFEAKPNNYGERTALRAELTLEYADGSRETIGTDESWTVTTGAILSSEIYFGEEQVLCAPVEELGKAVPFDASHIGALVAQEDEPVRVTKRFAPAGKFVTPRGELVLDFGQNIAGWVEIRLPETKDGVLTVRHAETLDRDGNFYTENLRSAVSTDTYRYGAEQLGMTVRPHFTFHGFRYIALEGVDESVDESLFCACALHTDMEKTMRFETDNKLVNQLVSNIEWGQRDNFLDVPTDCPQRNERLGWTGDAQVFASTASMQFDTALFFKKWLRDMACDTSLQWGAPGVVPNMLGESDGAAGWGDAAVIIPWRQYMAFGDLELLREQYPMMKTWIEYIRSKTLPNGLWQTGFQYGDWLALDIEAGSGDRTGGTDKYLVANAWYAYSTGILADAAEALGYAEEAAEYRALREKTVAAINEEYVTKTGRLVSETQTACVVMLFFDLVRPEFRERVLNTLTDNIAAHRNHLTTGFVGTPFLCHCLSENGQHALADEIFLKEDFPGWLYAVKKGATTIWERWDSIKPDGSFEESGMNSLNHYAYGSIASWLYQKVAGIEALEPGYRKFALRPRLTVGMEEVKAAFESPYGLISSAVTCRDGKITVDITVPANTTAVVHLPEQEQGFHLGSGSYHYEYATETSLKQVKYTLDCTLGDLVNAEGGRELFNQFAPGMLDTPMIQYAFPMKLSELIGFAPESKPLYLAVMDALNRMA